MNSILLLALELKAELPLIESFSVESKLGNNSAWCGFGVRTIMAPAQKAGKMRHD